MPEFISDVLNTFWSVTKTVTVFDVIDICLISYVVYVGARIVKETKASQLVKGILLFLAIYVVSSVLQLKVFNFLLKNILDVGLLALLIMFQPELRRILERVGRTKISIGNFTELNDAVKERLIKAIDAVCDACEDLSLNSVGALFVIERTTKLGEQIDTGIRLDAVPSTELFRNIFYPKAPLHDGAVIIRDGTVLAAACYLPKPQKEELIKNHLGSRHRAAIGMSETSDAVVIVVSEETGTVSIAENGELFRELNKTKLHKMLTARLIPVSGKSDTKKSGLKTRKRKTQ
ncbi:MAG: diadenylate cyclase CdaA [Oscillospiraceae bacterium]|nr:diadenylate cyclase CdaA [Oscillospiraceae bacterium]